jgi:hypothetical protein
MRNEKGQFKKGAPQPPEYEEKRRKILPGNKLAKKLTTDELKKAAYESYIKHISNGKVKKSWSFQKDGMTLTWETMEKYIREFPNEFDPILIQKAYSDGMAYWENIVDAGAKSERKVDTATLQMLMRNKFHWDRKDYEESLNRHQAEADLRKFRETVRPFPNSPQFNQE